MTPEQLAEYVRGYQDALEQRGYDDGATNTQGRLVVLRLTPRRNSGVYALGYQHALKHPGTDEGEPVPAT